jgi:hypothetical protein
MVRTFHVAILRSFLGIAKDSIRIEAPVWFSPLFLIRNIVVRILGVLPKFCCSIEFVGVSVAKVFLHGGELAQRKTLLLSHPGLGTRQWWS